MQSERLLFKPQSRDDFKILLDLDSDPDVMTYLTHGVPSTPEQVEAATQRVEDCFRRHNGKFGLWNAYEKSSGEFIGWFLFRPGKIEPDNVDRIEIGYRLRKKFWGKGYGTEGARYFRDYGFKTLGVAQIFALAMRENMASQNIMKKIGLKYMRDIQHPKLLSGDELLVEYEMNRDDWVPDEKV